MKKFVKYIVIIVLSTILIMIVLDAIYTYVYNNSIPRNKTEYLLTLKNKKIDYIFLGSSRVENHIVTKIVEQETGGTALNLGIQGGKLDVILLNLKMLLQNDVSFKKVFIQVDYIYNIEGTSLVYSAETIPYIRENKVIDDYHKLYTPNYKANYYVPFYRYAINDYKIGFREFFASTISKKTKMNYSDGFDGRNDAFSNSGYALPKKINKKNSIFEEIDALCKSNHIDVVYFCAPFCNETKNSDFTEKLKSKIPNFKDYSKAITDDAYFVNCGHLNEKGARLFTKILVDDCLKNSLKSF